MIKIQFIVDDGQSLKAYKCDEVEINMPTSDYFSVDRYKMEQAPRKFYFTAHNVIGDDSPTLVSIPDELLLRIRDYNIDTERQLAIEQTHKLNEKNSKIDIEIKLKQVELECLERRAEVYRTALSKIVDKYPEVAAQVALELGNLDAACHFAEKASKKRRKKNERMD